MQTVIQMQDPSLDRTFRGHRDVVTDIAFKPSMTQMASGSMDCSVMVWNFKPQMRALRFVGHKGPVTSVDFSPSGNLLASASRDKTVRLWTPNVKGDVTVFKAHTSAVRTVRFSKDGDTILTCSDDKSIKIWSTHRTKFQFTLAGHMNWVRTARFSPDARLVVSGSDDKSVKLWDLASKECVKTYWDHTGMITSVAFHPGGTTIATASTDKSIKLFDIRMHKLIQHYHEAHNGLGTVTDSKGGEAAWAGGGPNSISFGGPGGEWLISTGMDGVVKIWDLKEGHLFYTLHGHKNGPTTAATFSPEGAFFATGGSDAQVMVWKSNFDSGTPLNSDASEMTGKYKHVLPHGHAGNQHAHTAHPIHTEPTSSASFFTRKMASMNSALVTTLPGGIKSSPASPDRRENQNATPNFAGVNQNAENPEIVSVGGPIFNNVPNRSGSPNRRQEDDAVTTPLEVRSIPDELASSLQHIINQIDVLTQTMSILEARLTSNEDRVTQLTSLVSEAAGASARKMSAKQNPNSTNNTNNGTKNVSMDASSLGGSFMQSSSASQSQMSSQKVNFMGRPSPNLMEDAAPRNVKVQTQWGVRDGGSSVSGGLTGGGGSSPGRFQRPVNSIG
ncbi:POC1 centriolar protein A [Chytriomyces hyalinus]|nr:POC1 centriolar protein A [Chytriomyces hyalinus]